MDDWEEVISGCHFIVLRASLPAETTGVDGRFGITPSDCHSVNFASSVVTASNWPLITMSCELIPN